MPSQIPMVALPACRSLNLAHGGRRACRCGAALDRFPPSLCSPSRSIVFRLTENQAASSSRVQPRSHFDQIDLARDLPRFLGSVSGTWEAIRFSQIEFAGRGGKFARVQSELIASVLWALSVFETVFPWSETWNPPRDCGAEYFVLRTKTRRQGRFFVT